MAILLGSLSGGMQPSAPTIGTATAGDTTASVAFTASSYIGKGTITYTATSSPGGLTATGASSPLTVTGLTNGTAYTFTVVGTTNYGVASAASAASNSITPAASSGFYSLASHTFSGSTSTITFSSIPQTYKHLQINITAKSTTNSTGGFSYVLGTVNGDTGNNYEDNRLVGRSVSSFAGGTAYQGYLWAFGTAVTGASSLANFFGAGYLKVSDYTKTDRYKEWFGLNGLDTNGIGDGGSGAGAGSTWIQTSKWNNTAAINNLTFIIDQGNFASGSKISIYGII